MAYKITTLVENLVYRSGLKAEHGLSFLIETDRHRILFDTGASDLFIHNARELNIDLTKVDYLVLSHGHNDHTGGLEHFLRLNKSAQVYCRKEALLPKYKNGRDKSMPVIPAEAKGRFCFPEQSFELVDGVHLLMNVAVKDKNDTHFDRFFTERAQEVIPDTFEDEVSLVLETEKLISIVSTCSHRGITNIIRSAMERIPGKSLHTIIGGFHMHSEKEEEFCVVSGYLGRHLPRKLGVCHCAGVVKFSVFYQQFNDRVFYNYTGWEEVIE